MFATTLMMQAQRRLEVAFNDESRSCALLSASLTRRQQGVVALCLLLCIGIVVSLSLLSRSGTDTNTAWFHLLRGLGVLALGIAAFRALSTSAGTLASCPSCRRQTDVTESDHTEALLSAAEAAEAGAMVPVGHPDITARCWVGNFQAD